MGYTVTVLGESGSENYADFASGLGLEQFRQAVESAECPELLHLLDYGWSDDLPAISAELAVIASSANQDVVHSAKVVQAAIEESGLTEATLLLSDGVENDQSAETEAQPES